MPSASRCLAKARARQNHTKTLCPLQSRRLLGAVEDMPSNAAAPDRITGGAGGACASAVAAGNVRFAVGVDHLAGIRVRTSVHCMIQYFMGSSLVPCGKSVCLRILRCGR